MEVELVVERVEALECRTGVANSQEDEEHQQLEQAQMKKWVVPSMKMRKQGEGKRKMAL